MRVYRIAIQWNASPTTDAQQPQADISLNPQISVRHLQLIDHCAPTAALGFPDLDQDGAQNVRLAQLAVVPPAPSITGAESELYLIIALFNSVADDFNQTRRTPPTSVLARWTVGKSEPALHESFKSLTSSNDKLSALTVSACLGGPAYS